MIFFHEDENKNTCMKVVDLAVLFAKALDFLLNVKKSPVYMSILCNLKENK